VTSISENIPKIFYNLEKLENLPANQISEYILYDGLKTISEDDITLEMTSEHPNRAPTS
jgi:hypothetical protein